VSSWGARVRDLPAEPERSAFVPLIYFRGSRSVFSEGGFIFHRSTDEFHRRVADFSSVHR